MICKMKNAPSMSQKYRCINSGKYSLGRSKFTFLDSRFSRIKNMGCFVNNQMYAILELQALRLRYMLFNNEKYSYRTSLSCLGISLLIVNCDY